MPEIASVSVTFGCGRMEGSDPLVPHAAERATSVTEKLSTAVAQSLPAGQAGQAGDPLAVSVVWPGAVAVNVPCTPRIIIVLGSRVNRPRVLRVMAH